MSGNSPKPRSPERLTMMRDIVARWDEDRGLLVTATFRYDEWCCGEAHETVDAIATVYDIYDRAQYRAAKKRYMKRKREFDEILEAEKNRADGEQLTLF